MSYLALLKHSSPVSKGTFAYKTGSMDTVRSISGVFANGRRTELRRYRHGQWSCRFGENFERRGEFPHCLVGFNQINQDREACLAKETMARAKENNVPGNSEGSTSGGAGSKENQIEGASKSEGKGEGAQAPEPIGKAVIELDRQAAPPRGGRSSSRHRRRHH